MEQRLRLVQGGQPRSDKRVSERRRLSVPGQIVWKDARGNTKLAEVVTRDVSEQGVSVECLNGAAIPLYRLVYFHGARDARPTAELPPPPPHPHRASAAFRGGAPNRAVRTPSP